VDHQTGLSNGVADQSLPEYKNNVLALAKLTRAFKLPAVITTSAADGPNGPLLPEVRAILPDAPIVYRLGEINAWDNAAFVAAVKATGRQKLLVAGVSTEVCVAFVALSAIGAGKVQISNTTGVRMRWHRTRLLPGGMLSSQPEIILAHGSRCAKAGPLDPFDSTGFSPRARKASYLAG
jgi:nicotinamidase-related amidase